MRNASHTEILVDVGSTGMATASSAMGRWTDAGAALRHEPGRRFAFHTRAEDRPWWSVDFGRIVPLRRLVVWNREDAGLDCAARAVPLRILLATEEAGAWSEIARIGFVFGGARSGRPLVLDLAAPLPARAVRLEVEGTSMLHLDRVEAFAGAPPLNFARVTALRCGGPEGWCADIAARHMAGLFSVCSTLLQSVIELRRHGIDTEAMDATGALEDFRSAEDPPDVFPALFAREPAAGLPLAALPAFRAADANDGRYRDLDLAGLGAFARRHFAPSAEVRGIERDLLARYGVDPARTVGLYYRGTDKQTEFAPADFARHIEAADRLLAADPRLRVLVQTDQAQVRDAAVRHFGARGLFFEELPVTHGSIGMHKLDVSAEHGVPRLLFAQRMVAATSIVARCRHIVTGTGNVALWFAIFRGTAEGVWQFDRTQALVPPPG